MPTDLPTTVSTINYLPPHLGDLLDRVRVENKPLTATYQGQVFVAMAPIKDFEPFEEIEDHIDRAYIEKKPGKKKVLYRWNRSSLLGVVALRN